MATQFVKSYSFIGQNQIEVKKDADRRDHDVPARQPIIALFNYLADETAVHWPKTEEFEIVYILYSFEKNEYLRVKTRIKEWETDRERRQRLDNRRLARARSLRHVRRAVRESSEPEADSSA